MHSFIRTLALCGIIAMLVACSSTRLAYNNLDWLVNWKSGDYVSLTREQKRWLSSRVETHKNWHCSNELPGYRDYLTSLQAELGKSPLTPELLTGQIPELQAAVDRLLVEMTPTLSTLLSELNPQQVDELINNLQLKQQELHERYGAPDDDVQNKERAERLEKRLSPWLGKLTAEQRQRIQVWSDELTGQNRVWLDNRAFWQEQFIDALEQREQPGFQTRINALLTDREQFWTPRFQERSEINAGLGAEMLADLLTMATDRQKQRMEKRFARLQQDLRQMECTAAT